MPEHLLNLRHVPDDEAEEIRQLLRDQNISFYETPPSRWGVSMGGFWINDPADAARARESLRSYQQQRQADARERWNQALQSGDVPTRFWQRFRDRPVTVLAALAAIIALMLLTVGPYVTFLT